jgi:peptidoglycan/xylan/chitin deacetylase (PgdA/CDA1 family)
MRRQIKSALGHLMAVSHLDAVLLRGTAVVVTFHRVQDGEDPRGLSISRAMFERYCRFFADHFRVVALADLIARLERGEPLDRQLAITFDDGYRDNFENAAPILETMSLPATVFVVSDWIGSEAWPWWDREDGARYPWMTWEQVAELRRRGIDIGAHTRTHPDLGNVSGDAATVEIQGSRIALEDRLGEPIELFAYPYGGPGNMAAANIDRVRAAGFRCCCSCYGGLTERGADPFHLRRIAITPWYASPHQFGLELVRQPGRPSAPARQRCCEISEATGF